MSDMNYEEYFDVDTVEPQEPPAVDVSDEYMELIENYLDKVPKDPIGNTKAEDPTDSIFGTTPEGDIYHKPFSASPHVLVAGTTGSGKSVAINFWMITMMVHSTPDQLKFAIVDPKMNEFIQYRSNPYMIADPIINMEDADSFVTYLTILMDRRYEQMSNVGARNIESYNEWARKNGEKEWYYLVTIVDEFSDLIGQNKDVDKPIVRIAQKARAAGIHLMLATQSPRAEVVTGLIKANLPTKVCMKVGNSTESMIMLDEPGGEELRGHGDMWVKWKGGDMERVQGGFIPDDQQNAILYALRQYYPKPKYLDYKKVVENFYTAHPDLAPREMQRKLKAASGGGSGARGGAMGGRAGAMSGRAGASDGSSGRPSRLSGRGKDGRDDKKDTKLDKEDPSEKARNELRERMRENHAKKQDMKRKEETNATTTDNTTAETQTNESPARGDIERLSHIRNTYRDVFAADETVSQTAMDLGDDDDGVVRAEDVVATEDAKETRSRHADEETIQKEIEYQEDDQSDTTAPSSTPILENEPGTTQNEVENEKPKKRLRKVKIAVKSKK